MKKGLIFLVLICFFGNAYCQVSRDSMDAVFTFLLNKQNDFEARLKLAKTTLKVAKEKKDTLYTLKTLQKIGDMFWYEGIFSRSEDFYISSLKLCDSLRFPNEYAYALYSIGWIESVQKKKEEKAHLLKRALKIYTTQHDTNGIVSVLNAISGAYSAIVNENPKKKTHLIDSSITYLLKAISILKAQNTSTTMLSSLYANISEHYFANKDFKKTLFYVNKVLVHENLKKRRAYSQAIVIKAKTFYELNQADSCIQILSENIELIKKISSKVVLKTAYRYLYLSFKAKGNNQKALFFFEKYNLLSEQINAQLLNNKYEEIETSYKILRKEREISELMGQNKMYKIKEKQKQYMLIIAIFIIVIIVFFLLGIKKQNKRIKNLNEDISIQKHTLEVKHNEIQDSINYAKRIQEAILPSRFTLSEQLKNGFVLFKPKDIVSGDFYWLEQVGGATYLAAADCTGHGVPGAMVSVVCSNALSKALLEENITETGKLLDRARELVVSRFDNSNKDVKDGMDISLCKLEGNKLQWSGANNPLWIIRNSDMFTSTTLSEQNKSTPLAERSRSKQNNNNREVSSATLSHLEEIKPDKQPIGKSHNTVPFKTHNLSLEKGDSFYLFTDGYADQFGGEKGKKFMYKSLKDLLLQIQTQSMEEQKTILSNTFENWKGNLEQVDDVCVIGVRL